MVAFLSSPYSTIFPVIFYSPHSSFCPLARKLGLKLLCFATHFCDCIHVYSKQKEQEWGGERAMATTLLVQWYFGFSSSSPIYLLFTFQSLQIASLCILFKLYSCIQWERQCGVFLLHQLEPLKAGLTRILTIGFS